MPSLPMSGHRFTFNSTGNETVVVTRAAGTIDVRY
jgi:hypothetical protein